MPVLRGVKAEKNDKVCLPKDGKVVEGKSVFGIYEDSEMLSQLKALALNHCEPGVSSDSIQPLWNQTLQVRKLMALSDTEYPRIDKDGFGEVRRYSLIGEEELELVVYD